MAPISNTLLLAETQIEKPESPSAEKVQHRRSVSVAAEVNQTESNESHKKPYKMQIVWLNVVLMIYLHSSALYGAYILLTRAKLATWIFTAASAIFCGLGITAGAHRLWAHKSYNAKWPLRLILMIAQTAAHQNSIFDWVRDHRVHHKYTDSDADPYNAKRGFFFSHVGWLMVRKHPEVVAKGKLIDLSDLLADPLVRFQKNYFMPLMLIFCFYVPTAIPMYLWGESLSCAWYCCVFRYAFGLNGTWLVNSAAHIWGMKPYEKTISPSNNKFVAGLALGEGWHNYHHVFPWDYKTAELGQYSLNWTTAFIDFFSKNGWAYNRKTVSEEMIRKRVLRTGDGSHEHSQMADLKNSFENYIANYEHSKKGDNIWGWDDKDLSMDERSEARIIN